MKVKNKRNRILPALLLDLLVWPEGNAGSREKISLRKNIEYLAKADQYLLEKGNVNVRREPARAGADDEYVTGLIHVVTPESQVAGLLAVGQTLNVDGGMFMS